MRVSLIINASIFAGIKRAYEKLTDWDTAVVETAIIEICRRMQMTGSGGGT